MRNAALLVNCTSLGMTGQPPLDLGLEALPRAAVVADLVYAPLETDLLARARAAAKDGDWKTAYAIASRVDDAYAPGTDVSAQPLGERDDYTSLTWLAGTAALNGLDAARSSR